MDYDSEEFQKVLDTWINGNASILSRNELIALIRYFEVGCKTCPGGCNCRDCKA